MYAIGSTGRKSGLLNSDSKILKITGYEMDKDQSGFTCTIRDAGLNELRIDACHWKQERRRLFVTSFSSPVHKSGQVSVPSQPNAQLYYIAILYDLGFRIPRG